MARVRARATGGVHHGERQGPHPKDWHRLAFAAGLPKTWTTRFAVELRRGIEASWQNKLTDGGVSFWLIYLDLLAEAFRRHYLSWPYVQWLYARRWLDATLFGHGPMRDVHGPMNVGFDLKGKLLLDGPQKPSDVHCASPRLFLWAPTHAPRW